MIEGLTINREVIHQDFHDFLNHTREDGHHTPLE
jgi:hypothetical protein